MDDFRLSHLIWRTIKLRVLLLLICIVTLLTTWSSLESGNRKAQLIDDKYCKLMLADVNRLNETFHDELAAAVSKSGTPQAAPLSVQFSESDFCGGSHSRMTLQIYGSPASAISKRFLSQRAAAISDDELHLFTTSNNDRTEAFRLEFKLTSGYTENSIEANALAVAAVVPFVVIGLVVIYFMLSRQEAVYRANLQHEIEVERNKKVANVNTDLAKVQFFARDPKLSPFNELSILAYSPDKLLTTSLLICVIYLLYRVTGTFLLELINISDTIFLSYPFALYCALFLAVLIVASNARYYPAALINKTALLITIDDLPEQKPSRFRWMDLSSKRVVIVSIAMAFVMMFLPWAYHDHADTSLFGYEWFMKYKTADQQGSLDSLLHPALSLSVFREIRVELIVVWLFFLVCLLTTMRRAMEREKVKFCLIQSRRWLSILVIFFSVDYLIYMAILQMQAMGPNPWPQDRMPGSMMNFSPTIFFYLFTGVSLFLALKSLSSNRTFE